MANLILNGSTSGSVTLSSPAVSGTTTLTLPTTSGTVLTNGTNTNFPAGSVVQVVNATYSTASSTTSTSFVDSGMSATITPSSSSNKIFALVNISRADSTAADRDIYFTIYRNSTNLGGGSSSALSYFNVVSSRGLIPVSMSVLDSPNTTSATTYKVYFFSGTGGIVTINNAALNSTITLMEIKG
jgi:hypothetical protein